MEIDYKKVKRVLDYVFSHATEGDANSVLNTIDRFCYEKEWCMNVGDIKGKLVCDAILKNKPKVLVELGGYLGYSAIKFASIAKDIPGAHYYSIEYDSVLVCVMEKMIRFAGLSEFVTVLNGDLESNLNQLRRVYNVDKIDFLFIDHLKDNYLSDFKLAEENNLFHSGSVIAADDVINPGAPDYLKYMQAHSGFQ